MKFTSEDLMNAMGLQVGDRVKVSGDFGHIFDVVKEERGIILQHLEQRYYSDLVNIIDQDIEILPRPKRVGDLKCKENKDCRTCPLCWICFIKIDEKNEMQTTLYEMLESFAVKDQEIYDLLKARLDKEVLKND